MGEDGVWWSGENFFGHASPCTPLDTRYGLLLYVPGYVIGQSLTAYHVYTQEYMGHVYNFFLFLLWLHRAFYTLNMIYYN